MVVYRTRDDARRLQAEHDILFDVADRELENPAGAESPLLPVALWRVAAAAGHHGIAAGLDALEYEAAAGIRQGGNGLRAAFRRRPASDREQLNGNLPEGLARRGLDDRPFNGAGFAWFLTRAFLQPGTLITLAPNRAATLGESSIEPLSATITSVTAPG